MKVLILQISLWTLTLSTQFSRTLEANKKQGKALDHLHQGPNGTMKQEFAKISARKILKKLHTTAYTAYRASKYHLELLPAFYHYSQSHSHALLKHNTARESSHDARAARLRCTIDTCLVTYNCCIWSRVRYRYLSDAPLTTTPGRHVWHEQVSQWRYYDPAVPFSWGGIHWRHLLAKEGKRESLEATKLHRMANNKGSELSQQRGATCMMWC